MRFPHGRRLKHVSNRPRGLAVAHKIPVVDLGIEIDATDAATFFDGLWTDDEVGMSPGDSAGGKEASCPQSGKSKDWRG